MTHALIIVFCALGFWSVFSVAAVIFGRHRRHFRARRRGGYLRPTASSTTNRVGKSTGRAIRISVGSSNSRTAPGGQSAGLEILPLHPERSRSTGGGLNGTTSPLTDGPSTGDLGRPRASAVCDRVLTAWRLEDGEWKPEYGGLPADAALQDVYGRSDSASRRAGCGIMNTNNPYALAELLHSLDLFEDEINFWMTDAAWAALERVRRARLPFESSPGLTSGQAHRERPPVTGP